jgi:hypothetical protein
MMAIVMMVNFIIERIQIAYSSLCCIFRFELGKKSLHEKKWDLKFDIYLRLVP